MEPKPAGWRPLPLGAAVTVQTPSRNAVVGWLEERLAEERRLLENRHAAICESLLLEMSMPHETDDFNLPAPPRQDVLAAKSAAAAAADATTCEGLYLEMSVPHELDDCQMPPALDSKEDPVCEVDVANSAPAAEQGRRPSLHKLTSSIRGQVANVNGPWLHRIVLGNHFEAGFGVLILTNSVIMALEVQHYGLAMEAAAAPNATSVDSIIEQGVPGWPGAEDAFACLEWFFGIVFTLEILLKIIVTKTQFVKSFWNLFDTIIVGFWLVSRADSQVESLPVNPMVLRACRLVRLLRLLRLAKMTSMFDTLVLMISSVQASAAVLLWGVVLLLLCMTVSALVLNSLLEDSMHPEKSTLDPANREAIYRMYGTYSRCMITMFEITLASWVAPCRLLVDHVSQWFAIFFLTYKCVVGFAVLKVITGVFLHETFKCAGMDDDLMIQNRRRMRKKFKAKMMSFFDEADGVHGLNGEVSSEEFVDMINDERVNTWLEAMDLRIRDVGAERIFAFLAGPDMALTREELCSGMSRLRGAAQGLDVVTLLEIAQPAIKMPPSKDIIRLTLPQEEKKHIPGTKSADHDSQEKKADTLAFGISGQAWLLSETMPGDRPQSALDQGSAVERAPTIPQPSLRPRGREVVGEPQPALR